ncbi:MAG: hypothetical protein AMXMBFR82_50310 [Candidatus Hydrogenedentota bacterium]
MIPDQEILDHRVMTLGCESAESISKRWAQSHYNSRPPDSARLVENGAGRESFPAYGVVKSGSSGYTETAERGLLRGDLLA